MSYFDKHPLIQYSNNVARNILTRVRFTSDSLNNQFAFQPYTTEEGDRADTLATDYYGSPHNAWLVYLSNNVVDPYYDISVATIDFNKTMTAKYGSVSKSQRVITGYRTNWEDDFSTLSTSAYDALPAGSKKYWTPVYDVNYNIYNYQRAQVDLFSATNQIKQITLSAATTFFEGEEVQVDGSNYATVVASSSTTLLVQHTVGTISASDTLTGQISGQTATVSTITTAAQVIPLDELAYWKTVTAYDAEWEKNLDKRNIQLLGKSYKDIAQRELYNLLNFK